MVGTRWKRPTSCDMAFEQSRRNKLDLIDRRLLSLLQQDNRMSLDELAEAVYSSKSAVQRRICRLRHDGIIRNDVAVLEPGLIEPLERFVVCLNVREERGDLLRTSCENVGALPSVQQCYLTTGDANCVLVVLLPNGQALRGFIEEHFTDEPFVRGFQAHLVTKGIKVGLSVPIEQ